MSGGGQVIRVDYKAFSCREFKFGDVLRLASGHKIVFVVLALASDLQFRPPVRTIIFVILLFGITRTASANTAVSTIQIGGSDHQCYGRAFIEALTAGGSVDAHKCPSDNFTAVGFVRILSSRRNYDSQSDVTHQVIRSSLDNVHTLISRPIEKAFMEISWLLKLQGRLAARPDFTVNHKKASMNLNRAIRLRVREIYKSVRYREMIYFADRNPRNYLQLMPRYSLQLIQEDAALSGQPITAEFLVFKSKRDYYLRNVVRILRVNNRIIQSNLRGPSVCARLLQKVSF